MERRGLTVWGPSTQIAHKDNKTWAGDDRPACSVLFFGSTEAVKKFWDNEQNAFVPGISKAGKGLSVREAAEPRPGQFGSKARPKQRRRSPDSPSERTKDASPDAKKISPDPREAKQQRTGPGVYGAQPGSSSAPVGSGQIPIWWPGFYPPFLIMLCLRRRGLIHMVCLCRDSDIGMHRRDLQMVRLRRDLQVCPRRR